jgi:N-acetylmuramoyl-L-alanine amidase
VRQFQRARGLFETGVCDEHTWNALVEASWTLGDRQLFLTSPNLRGDDVIELQTALARLGFDCGRVDGIFGPLALRAVRMFQAEAGIIADGVCGQETVRALALLGDRSGSGPGVAMLREHEELLAGGGSIAGARLAVGQFGTFGPLSRLVAKDVRGRGASVIVLDEPDPLAQAEAANAFQATAYVAFEAAEEPTVDVHFYQVPAFESARGHQLADTIASALACHLGVRAAVSGMRLPVLRETRMPAVHLVFGPVATYAELAPDIAVATAAAIEQWISGRES